MRQHRKRREDPAGGLTIVGMALLVALLTPGARASPPIPVVATFSILGDWVKRIGGDRVQVTTLVGANGDAHVYEPTPTAARAVAGALAVFVNGLGFEGWLSRLIDASGSSAAVIVTSDGVNTLSGGFSRIGGAGSRSAQDVDPHAWHSVPNALIYVARIVAGLCRMDAQGCAGYEANASAYTRELRALDSEIRSTIAGIPEQARTVVTSHDSFGYYAHEYGVEFLTAQGFSTESEASAADVARLIDQIRKHQASGLFLENINDPRLMQQVARETGFSPGGELYSDALSNESGPAASYLEMMRNNTRTLRAGIQQR